MLVFPVVITFAQYANVKAVLFRNSTAPGLAYHTVSLTLYTDPALKVNRPNVSIKKLNFPFVLTTPLTQTLIVNGYDESVYTRTLNYEPNIGFINFLDSFWVAGVRNFVTDDRSRIYIQSDMGQLLSFSENEGPQVTNLPLGPSNFTLVGNQVTYNPMCTDADGDSLSYQLGWLSGSDYYLAAKATINPTTGLCSFSKDSTDQGIYGFSIRVYDWRRNNGTLENCGVTNLGFVFTTNLALSAIENYRSTDKVNLYPNPSNGKFTLDGTGDLLINDMLGREVLKKQIAQKEEVEIKTKGIYIVTLKSEKEILTRKIVVE